MNTWPIAGHTLSTPHQTVPEALELFRSAGLDAAEVIWQDDYRSGISESDNADELSAIRAASRRTEMPIIGLTPYMSGINSHDADERRRDIERFRACIRDARTLGAGIVRVYAGAYTPDQVSERPAKWAHLVASLKSLAPFAADHGVTLAVENHFNTMTMTAEETVRLVDEVDDPAVRILYDQTNLTFTHSEHESDAIPLQAGRIAHVHVKDLVFVDRDRPFSASSVATVSGEERAVRSRVVGEGEMDWPSILSALATTGYDGQLSLEYEYRWHPQDLEPPITGLRRGADHIRSIIADLQSAATRTEARS